MRKIKLMFVIGTRPEAIKLAPIIQRAQAQTDRFKSFVIATSQHRQMLDDVLESFDISPDRDFNIMTHDQSLFRVTSKIIENMESVVQEFNPHILIVQGDTITTFAAALCGFYAGIRVAHVEAGLRSGDKQRPFPEEVNRKMTSVIADYHFAPTETAKKNLVNEGCPVSMIYVTGNTVIDALNWMIKKVRKHPCTDPKIVSVYDQYPNFVLVTGHRRENFGAPVQRIFSALRRLSIQNPDNAFVYPVHMNPNVQKPASAVLGNLPNVFLLPPLSYPTFCWLMDRCRFIITDSGGIQEEAPALAKPVLVTRQVTERPEAVQMGMVKLVGDDEDAIIQLAQRLLDDEDFYSGMAKGYSPYGDGKAADRILDMLSRFKTP
jgi:UDP-N-acetylglucosamine 2-epimerase (non-hydrolysing)